MRVVDWCVSWLARLICCRIILKASSPGGLLIYHSFVICLLVLPSLHSGWVRCLLLDLDPYGGTDPFGMFILFLKRTDVVAPCLSAVFQWLVRLRSFKACWRHANVTPILNGPPSSSVSNYWQISITSVLSKMFERLVSVHLGWFMEWSGVLPATQFAYWKGLGTCDALLCVCHVVIQTGIFFLLRVFLSFFFFNLPIN